MGFSLYFILGVMDILAVFALAFRIFRLPYFDSFKDIFIIAILVNIMSYLLRMVLEWPQMDPPLQLVMFVLFLRFKIKLRISSSFLMAVCGNALFNSIQFILYNILNESDILTKADAISNASNGIQMLQFVNDTVCFFLAYLLYEFGLGFAFITAPPQDLIHEDRIISRPIFIFLVICSALVCLTIIFANVFIDFFLLVSVVYIISVTVLLHYTHKKDYERTYFDRMRTT